MAAEDSGRKRMKKGYWVTNYRMITDPEALKNYSALAGPAIEAAGGKFLSRGTAIAAHEAGWVERPVIVELDRWKWRKPPARATPIVWLSRQ
jgi:uncharacterized protein (DUF1330 family)